VILAIALATIGASALAASGELDTTFSGDGKLTTAFVAGQQAQAWDIAVQANGRIVVVGDTIPSATDRNIALARYTPAGALDTTFNTTGRKIVNLGGNDQGLALAIQPATGKIVVAGQKCPADWSSCDAAALRLNPGGGFDTTFNLTGKRITDFGGGDNGSQAVSLYPGNRIVAAGYMFNSGTGNYDMAVIRYTAGGALDTTFSGDGRQSINFGAGRLEEIGGIAVQPDGKILVGGHTCETGKINCNFALARLNANGSLDTTFNKTGKAITNFGANDTSWALALQPDGRIVMAGLKDTGTTGTFALARYNTNGSLDTTFAGTGKLVTDFSGDANREHANAVTVQPDGKIVVCGAVFNGSTRNFALARYTKTGALDVTFSGDGKATVDFGRDDRCSALALQGDGKYVVAGVSEASGLKRWVLARVLP
jgi:uncharacterized delta-60 repeat protein